MNTIYEHVFDSVAAMMVVTYCEDERTVLAFVMDYEIEGTLFVYLW
jgi:hypothetical protein